jgi:hypothetical protein
VVCRDVPIEAELIKKQRRFVLVEDGNKKIRK